MKVEFSDHAIAQLGNRPRIKREMVIETIKSPDAARVSYNKEIYTVSALVAKLWRL